MTPAAVLVVVPARDEEALLPRCLDTLRAAVATLALAHPDVETRVVVVADACTDRTADLARAAGAHVVEVDVACVGRARAAGVSAGEGLLSETDPERVWVTGTDADTRVPQEWLSHQVELASAGARLVVGGVTPDPDDLEAAIHERWHTLHATSSPDHVYGANLGFRLDDYRAVGGWPSLSEHEDRVLVAALRERLPTLHTGLPVLTSGRLEARSPGGFAGYLRGLAGGLAGGLADGTVS